MRKESKGASRVALSAYIKVGLDGSLRLEAARNVALKESEYY